MTVRHPYSPLILLIDDSVFEQCLLIDLLSEQNYRVTLADNGIDGYRKALLAKPDLILQDVQMPGLDGFALCAMLKANPETHPQALQHGLTPRALRQQCRARGGAVTAE